VLTSAGKLPFKGIIHVAGIDMLWRASERSICDSVRGAMAIVHEHGFGSVAFPAIGAGSGSFDEASAIRLIERELASLDGSAVVRIVRFRPVAHTPRG
jgi:O-acetyl-ADP-ribose deacetylase (regulator of RNase III)